MKLKEQGTAAVLPEKKHFIPKKPIPAIKVKKKKKKRSMFICKM